MASVQCKGQRVRILVEGPSTKSRPPPRQSLGLESQRLLADGTWSSNREPGCLATRLQRVSKRWLLASQGLLVREAGGGGLAVSITPGQPGWAVSYVQLTTEKDGGWAGVSARSKASDSRQGQSTSMEKRPYNGSLN